MYCLIKKSCCAKIITIQATGAEAMKISKTNLIIYIISLSLSAICIGLYFINPSNPGCVLSCGIGSSGIGAVLLGLVLEIANNTSKEKALLKNRADILYPITLMLRSSICNFIKLLNENGHIVKSTTVRVFFSEFEKLHYSFISGENGFWNNIDQSNYVKKVKSCFAKAPIMSNAIIEINNNRSFIIKSGILTDNEIQNLFMTDFFLTQIEKAIDITDVFHYLLNLFSYINLKEMVEIAIEQNENGLSFYYNNQKIHIFKN